MTPEVITESLRARGIRQIDIVTGLGMPLASRTIISLVIRRMSRSRRVESAIAEAIQRPLAEVFPEWYGPSAKNQRRVA